MSHTLVSTTASIALTYAVGYQVGRMREKKNEQDKVWNAPESMAEAVAIAAFARPFVNMAINLAGFNTPACQETGLCTAVYYGATALRFTLPTIIGKYLAQRENPNYKVNFFLVATTEIAASAIITYANPR